MKPYHYIIIFLILTSGSYGMYNITRGIRNKNPGNIRYNSANDWQGQTGKDLQGFVKFSEVGLGIRAMTKLLKNYYYKYGLNSVSLIISRWAPSNENNTQAYIDSVSKALSVEQDEMINLENYATLFLLVKAIIKHENGSVPYTELQINEGIALA